MPLLRFTCSCSLGDLGKLTSFIKIHLPFISKIEVVSIWNNDQKEYLIIKKKIEEFVGITLIIALIHVQEMIYMTVDSHFIL